MLVAAAGIAGCSNGGATDVQPESATVATLSPVRLGTITQVSEVVVVATEPTVEADCPNGDWIVTHLTMTTPTDQAPVTIDADTAGLGLLVANGDWTLAASLVTVGATVDGADVDLVIDGTVVGSVGRRNANVNRANGSVQFAGESESRPFGFDDFVAALSPDGFTVHCDDDPVTWTSSAATMVLAPAPQPTTSTDLATEPTLDGPELEFRSTPPVESVTCGGRPVTIVGSAINVRLDGACASITIRGNRNSVSVGQVGTVTIDGDANLVVHAQGTPAVTDDGGGNRVEPAG